jgi:hypothetical protein
LQLAFPLNILIVPSSAITSATYGEHLTHGRFSLGKTVRLGNFEFIANYFNNMSLSPRRGNLGTDFMGSTSCGTPSPRWVMIEDFAKEFLTTSREEGGFGLPSPRRRSTGASPALMTTTP